MRVLDGDAHLLEHGDGGFPKVHASSERNIIEIATLVDRNWRLRVILLLLEQVEFDFGMQVEGEALLPCLCKVALQNVARVAHAGLSFRGENIAEHARRTLIIPRQGLEGGSVGAHDHIVLGNAGEAFDCRTVETNPLFKGGFEFSWCDSDRLEHS